MHTIRLRGAWETTPRNATTTHARSFGRPRTLDPGERVWLVCSHVPGPCEVLLNGNTLGTLATAGPFAADVTDHLQPRNSLAFVVASADPLGDVALEMRTAAG